MRTAIATLMSLMITTLAFGQWDQIQRLPNQSQDSDHGGSPLYSGGGDVVFASNGDLLVFYTENGAFTDPANGYGTPAEVKMARSTDGGATWVEPVVILKANPNGVQNFGAALAAVNPVSGRITLVFFNQDGHGPQFQLEDQTWRFGRQWRIVDPSRRAFGFCSGGGQAHIQSERSPDLQLWNLRSVRRNQA